MTPKDFAGRVRRLAYMQDELMLATTILRYAQSGHATPLMVEQAIVLLEASVKSAKDDGDDSMVIEGESLIERLRQALAEGVHTLRVKRGPGPEVLYVEEPLARDRIARGHRIRRQHRCSTGVVDIYDLTIDEIIECKYRGTGAALGEAAAQLNRYRKSFPGTALVIAVLSIETEALWLADVLRREGFTFIEVGRGS